MRVSREQAAKNREKILDVASRMFRRYGIDGIGIADLMKESGLTHGALYSHFDSKEQLVAESCAHAMKKGVERWKRVAGEAVEEGDDPLAVIVRMYLSRTHREKVDQGCLVAALTTELARQNRATRQAFTESLRPLIDLIVEHSGAGPAAAARKKALAALSSMVGSLILARTVDDPELSDEFLETVAESLVEPPARSKSRRRRVDGPR